MVVGGDVAGGEDVGQRRPAVRVDLDAVADDEAGADGDLGRRLDADAHDQVVDGLGASLGDHGDPVDAGPDLGDRAAEAQVDPPLPVHGR